MAPVTLPPSFYNSFWSPDYRTGLDVLFHQLESGCIENKDISAFIESQARAHHQLSVALLEPPLPANRQSTTSLEHSLLSLRAASSARGEAHRSLAMELEEHVLLPFNGWRHRHESRIDAAHDDMLGRGGVIASWEKAAHRLMGLRQTYLSKSRAADDSEDDAKFAPATAASPTTPDSSMASPASKRSSVQGGAGGLQRSGTVADRISEKLRAANRSRPTSLDGKNQPPVTPSKTAESPTSPTKDGGQPQLTRLRPVEKAEPDSPTTPTSPTQEDAFIPPTDPEGRPIMAGEALPAVPDKDGATAPAQGPQGPAVLLSGLRLSTEAFKSMLLRFDEYLHTHAALGTSPGAELSIRSALASRQRSTILGTYEKTFSGEEIVEWLSKYMTGYGGEWDRCVDAAGELHRMGHVSRIGVGRGFEPTDETFYVLRIDPNESVHLPTNITSSFQNQLSHLNVNMPNMPSMPAGLASATASTNFSLLKGYFPGALGSDEPIHIRLRREASKADETYREGVHEAEERRLEMEERIERGLRMWEKWERERLGVIRSVLKHYEETLAKLPGRLEKLQEGTTVSIEAYKPESDLKALIEGSRTGPFRPRPHIYESAEADIPTVNFGVDLRRWAGDTAWKTQITSPKPVDAVPAVFEALMRASNELGADIKPDEQRRSWLYEIPLEETHMLRNAVNNTELTVDDITMIAKKFNVHVVNGTAKLWLLELNPPVLGWEGWEDAKAIYPSVGADQERDVKSALTSVLGRLPASQLFTLNAAIKHFRDLIDATKTKDEDDKIYLTKLSLSLGRCLLRPQYETELTIQDRTPSLFLADLIENYDSVFPGLLEKKRTTLDRPMPQRKRTALVDQRISRKSGSDAAELIEQKRELQQKILSERDAAPGQAPAPQAPVAQPVSTPAPVQQQQQQAAPASQASPPSPIRTQQPSPPVSAPRQASPTRQQASPPARFHTPPQAAAPQRAPAAPPISIPPTGPGGPPMDFPSPVDSDDGGAFTPPPPPAPAAAFARPAEPTTVSHTRVPSSPTRPLSMSSPSPTPSGGRGSPAPGAADDAISQGAPGLKRNTSSDVSRFRGPKGARGPRPAPGHQGRGSVSSMAARFESK